MLISNFKSGSADVESKQRNEILRRHGLMKMAQQESMWTYSSLLNLLFVEQMGLKLVQAGEEAPLHWKIHAVTVTELIADLTHLMFPEAETDFFDNSTDIGKSFIADASKSLMRICKSIEVLEYGGAGSGALTPELRNLFGHHKTFTIISKEVRRIPITEADVPRASKKAIPGARVFLKIVEAASRRKEFQMYAQSSILLSEPTELNVFKGRLSNPSSNDEPIPIAKMWFAIAQSFSENVLSKAANKQI